MKPFAWAVFLTVIFAAPAVPQSAPSSTALKVAQHRETEIDPKLKEMERQRQRAANKERQVKLQRDADRLLQLATELKLYVDKSNENVLSLEVVKKTNEIEKLARSIRENMKNGY